MATGPGRRLSISPPPTDVPAAPRLGTISLPPLHNDEVPMLSPLSLPPGSYDHERLFIFAYQIINTDTHNSLGLIFSSHNDILRVPYAPSIGCVSLPDIYPLGEGFGMPKHPISLNRNLDSIFSSVSIDLLEDPTLTPLPPIIDDTLTTSIAPSVNSSTIFNEPATDPPVPHIRISISPSLPPLTVRRVDQTADFLTCGDVFHQLHGYLMEPFISDDLAEHRSAQSGSGGLEVLRNIDLLGGRTTFIGLRGISGQNLFLLETKKT